MSAFLGIRTLSLVTGVSAVAMCLCMVYIAVYRKTYPGFYHWTAGAMANGLGFALLSLRDHLPDLVTVILANTLILGSVILICRGLVLFCDLRQKNRLDLSLLAGFLFGFFYFTYGQPAVSPRIVVVSWVIGFFALRAAWLATYPVAKGLAERNWLLVASLAVTGLWLAFRGFFTLYQDNLIADFMSAGTIQGFSFVICLGTNLLTFIGLISINSNRLEKDLYAALAEIRTLRGIIPICSSCKKIRDDQGYWRQVEKYVQEHSEAEFSHSCCPECAEKLYPFLRKS